MPSPRQCRPLAAGRWTGLRWADQKAVRVMGNKCRPVRLAVDIGGTFTDIVLLAGEQRLVAKVLTTPREPEVAVIEGAKSALAEALRAFSDIDLVVHGTTLATNAIIERKGARIALIAT